MLENTLENKAKFFAQYWGQDCLHTKRGKGSYIMGDWRIFDEDYLLLKPLSSITDEDAVEVAKLINSYSKDLKTKILEDKIFGKNKKWCRVYYESYNTDTHEVDDVVIFNVTDVGLITHQRGNAYMEQWVKAYQYLQSKSYALPFMGLSVEQLIEDGWLKLKS